VVDDLATAEVDRGVDVEDGLADRLDVAEGRQDADAVAVRGTVEVELGAEDGVLELGLERLRERALAGLRGLEEPGIISVSPSERKPTAWLRVALSGMRKSLPTKLMPSADRRMPWKPSGLESSPPKSRTLPLASPSRMGPRKRVFIAPEKDAVSAATGTPAAAMERHARCSDVSPASRMTKIRMCFTEAFQAGVGPFDCLAVGLGRSCSAGGGAGGLGP
jgi:hypothetical protein